MNRVNPNNYILKTNENLEELPCSYLSLRCACKDLSISLNDNNLPKINKEGYCKLQDMNKSIKSIFNNSHYNYIKRIDRISLKEFLKKHNNDKYIICVQGHFIYANGSSYISYFNNDEDSVIATWKLS